MLFNADIAKPLKVPDQGRVLLLRTFGTFLGLRANAHIRSVVNLPGQSLSSERTTVQKDGQTLWQRNHSMPPPDVSAVCRFAGNQKSNSTPIRRGRRLPLPKNRDYPLI
jgi:hypothetical protein